MSKFLRISEVKILGMYAGQKMFFINIEEKKWQVSTADSASADMSTGVSTYFEGVETQSLVSGISSSRRKKAPIPTEISVILQKA